MEMMVKIATVLLSTLFLLQVNAKEITLFEVNNTKNGDRFNLVLEVNKFQEATGLKLFNLREQSWKHYDLSDLERGVALRIESGYEVIRLKSSDFEIDRGGNFTLDYLVNALKGNRRELPLEFDFNGDAWKVYHKGAIISRLDFVVNTVFGRNIGISAINPR